MRNRIPFFAVLTLMAGAWSQSASAQQTIFNHPSADLLSKGAVYVELDATLRYQFGFEGLVPRVVWAPIERLEIGLNVGPLIDQAFENDPSLAPNAKIRLFSAAGTAGEISLLLGTRIYVPVKFDALNFELYSFVAVQTRFGLRATAGAYGEFPTNGVGKLRPIAMLEFVLTKFLTFGAEWWMERDLGLGFVIALPAGFTLYPAYLLSPAARERDGFIFEIGKLF
ncbi:MAG: hypothetical protein HYY84_03930 [Deltaproteobacteria bacterium]|nr:hypothetical protein [Deltaproteobacteria bacterium]